jgi:hypothetical protein
LVSPKREGCVVRDGGSPGATQFLANPEFSKDIEIYAWKHYCRLGEQWVNPYRLVAILSSESGYTLFSPESNHGCEAPDLTPEVGHFKSVVPSGC